MEDFHKKVVKIVEKDSRYKADAYEFVMHALWFTQDKLKRKGHVTGRELLEGVKEFGLAQYGPMAVTVLEHWGVTTTQDFGEIVFNLVENNILKTTEGDSIDDFKDVYEIKKVFDVTEELKLED
jgi:uncharacterized repeat protein (TIGR04138 family)